MPLEGALRWDFFLEYCTTLLQRYSSIDGYSDMPYELCPFFIEMYNHDLFLLVNDGYEYILLKKDDLNALLDGRLKNNDLLRQLEENGFISTLPLEIWLRQASTTYENAREYLYKATSLFIFVTTMECNLKCIYCQAEKIRDKKINTAMTEDTASKGITMLFDSPSRSIVVEFQGGEPLLNFKLIKFIVQTIEEQNKNHHKNITYSITTNLQAIDREKLSFLLRHNVSICLSCDGPESLQKKNRPTAQEDSSNFQKIIQWTPEILAGQHFLGGIATATADSLKIPREIVRTYRDLSFNSITLRPITALGKGRARSLSYTAQTYVDFYVKAFDEILKINESGHQLSEGFANLFFAKIIRKVAHNHSEFRSPCGAAIGQIVIDWNGIVYTCDEARMLAQLGEDKFRIGNVNERYRDILSKPIIKEIATASCLEAHPSCYDCAFSPFCGVCPVVTYSQKSMLSTCSYNTFTCQVNRGIFKYLFSLMLTDSERILKIVKNW